MTAKDEQDNGMQVVACEEQLGDTAVVTSGYTGDGSLMVSEEVSGPSASVAYGEPSHKVRIVFAPAAVDELALLLGNGAKAEEIKVRLDSFFRGGRHALIDLMDLCDAKGVPYSYQALGSATGVTYRPATERL